MTTRATVWIDALRSSSQQLRTAVTDLPPEMLGDRRSPTGWSVAQVLSHLGSAAEICTALVQRGIDGDTVGPGPDDTQPVWRRFDAMPPAAQREAWLAADARHLDLSDSLDAAQRDTVRIPYVSGLLDVAGYAGYRLSEQSIHGWDVAVALDPAAGVPAPEAELLRERIDLVATRFRDADTLRRLGPAQLAVELTEPTLRYSLILDTELHVDPAEAADPTSTVSGGAEAVLRLVYGRARSVDDVSVTGKATLDDLRALFPGY